MCLASDVLGVDLSTVVRAVTTATREMLAKRS